MNNIYTVIYTIYNTMNAIIIIYSSMNSYVPIEYVFLQLKIRHFIHTITLFENKTCVRQKH